MEYSIFLFIVFTFIIGCDNSTKPQTMKKETDKERWNRKYKKTEYIYGKDPVTFLKQKIHLLAKGKVLDIAAGEGRNSVFLAQHGYEVDAMDVSDIGLQKARDLATEKGVKIHTIVADLTKYTLSEQTYDLVANFYYLQRDLIPQIKKTLKPGGMVIFETYTVEHLTIPTAHKLKREYCLEKDELKQFFSDFKIIFYQETKSDTKGTAQLIAQKNN